MPTPINKVWNTIRKIKSKGTAVKYKHPQLGNQIFTDKKEMSNIIDQTISKIFFQKIHASGIQCL